ncbi:MAG: DUF2905 domain-containing protein [Blastocatellia bacterium AA13]|nr:MAG: DUF2905 domain-containing protein [Blastocatellia bacterium AA13]
MDGPGTIGKYLLIAGAVIAALGAVVIILEKFSGLRIGKLPGDIYIERGGWRFYFPLMTSILISLILTLILWFVRRR